VEEFEFLRVDPITVVAQQQAAVVEIIEYVETQEGPCKYDSTKEPQAPSTSCKPKSPFKEDEIYIE